MKTTKLINLITILSIFLISYSSELNLTYSFKKQKQINIIEFPKNYFIGHWYAIGYLCNENIKLIHEIEIDYNENFLIAKSLNDDICLSSGQETFRGNLPEKIMNDMYIPFNWTVSYSNKDLNFSAGNIKIINSYEFMVDSVRLIKGEFTKNLLKGKWIGSGFNCTQYDTLEQEIDIEIFGNMLVAKKTNGCGCFNAGTELFKGLIKKNKLSLNEPILIIWKHNNLTFQNPQSVYGAMKLHNINEFSVGKLKFYRADSVINYPVKEYFNGHWYAKGYTCNSNTPKIEQLEIKLEENAIVGLKTQGDDCVTSGNLSFFGIIQSSIINKIDSIPIKLVTGNEKSPNSGIASSKIEILNYDKFESGSITYFRAQSKIVFKKDYFEGFWYAIGYSCNSKTPSVQEIKIVKNGDDFVATKIKGDSCVTTGNETFRGVIPKDGINNINEINVKFVVGYVDRPNSGKSDSTLEIINEDHFISGNIKFFRNNKFRTPN